ncbi:YihY/virulence factor BrkB family protein [Natronobiforma cellulositropha]|uniref:YihY/virulence factor BrkB family protein n=1 Tax=Natronobiforma cellulositropha TaxID=1679076 RepID=UPI0021D59AB0|nr:YihY/virulence factor BrkB family protein [Natronobiforma cellulositropha]
MALSRDLESLGRRVAHLAIRKQLTLLAAGVAFYAFFSLVPLVILGVVITTVVGGEELAHQLSDAFADVLTPSARALLTEAFTEDTGRGGATLVGLGGLLWGGSRVLRGLDRAFSDVYGTVASVSFLNSFRNAGIVAVAVSLGVLAVVGAETVLAAAVGGLAGIVTPLFAFVTIFAVFLPLYVVFPNTDVDVREALPGTAFAAAGWTLLGRLFAVYAGVAGDYALYGALGAVFLVMTWLYVGAAIVILGAVINAVLAGRDVDRQVQSPGARQVSTGAMTDDATGPDDVQGEPADASATGGASHSQDGSISTASARTRDRADDPAILREEIERLRDRLEEVESGVERRTVRRESLESDLKRYVRRHARRGHAHGWGPYLVLLYGTAMAIAAFYFLEGLWAILAMFVVWTSTLGVYVLMVLFGTTVSVLGLPGRLRDRVGEWRS